MPLKRNQPSRTLFVMLPKIRIVKKKRPQISNITKSLCQAMNLYGGCCTRDLFALNFVALSLSIVKPETNKGLIFVVGDNAFIFQCVSTIYKEAMATHEVVGHACIILAKDDTKVKVRIS